MYISAQAVTNEVGRTISGAGTVGGKAIAYKDLLSEQRSALKDAPTEQHEYLLDELKNTKIYRVYYELRDKYRYPVTKKVLVRSYRRFKAIICGEHRVIVYPNNQFTIELKSKYENQI